MRLAGARGHRRGLERIQIHQAVFARFHFACFLFVVKCSPNLGPAGTKYSSGLRYCSADAAHYPFQTIDLHECFNNQPISDKFLGLFKTAQDVMKSTTYRADAWQSRFCIAECKTDGPQSREQLAPKQGCLDAVSLLG